MKRFLFLIIVLSLSLSACSSKSNSVKEEAKIIDKIEILHIHEVTECYPCRISGQYVEEVINESFSDELSLGKLVYDDIDKSDPSNNEIIEKYDVVIGYSGIYIGLYTNKGFESSEYTALSDLDYPEKFKDSFRNHILGLLEVN